MISKPVLKYNENSSFPGEIILRMWLGGTFRWSNATNLWQDIAFLSPRRARRPFYLQEEQGEQGAKRRRRKESEESKTFSFSKENSELESKSQITTPLDFTFTTLDVDTNCQRARRARHSLLDEQGEFWIREQVPNNYSDIDKGFFVYL